MKIGAVDLDYVSDIEKPANKSAEMVWGAGMDRPIPFEDLPDLEKITIPGTLVKNATYTKTLEQQIEDLLSLKYLNAAYNSVNVPDLKGFLSVSAIKPKVSARKAGLREVSLEALLYPSKQYQRLLSSQPVVFPNDFSFALGTNDVDEYLALPVGASYLGGDGITTTRTAEDGTIKYMLATSAKDVKFDLSADEINVGEIKVWDDMNLGEASWIRIFNREHVFTGKTVIQNGLYRVIFDTANDYVSVYYWNASAYTKIDDFKSGTFTTIKFISITPDIVSLELDSGVTVDMVRGHPPQIDTGDSDLLATSLAFLNQSTGAENYLSLGTNLYIASNRSFSIIGGIRNLGKGKKWIYRETDAVIAEDIAHQAMVSHGLQRELVLRAAEKIIQYGITWNESADTYTRTGVLQGVAVGSSPGNALLPIQSKMRRCVINDAGVVQYYLDPADSTKKADGTPANLDGTDGQVMVEIPAFYYRYLYAGTTHLWEISPVAKTGFTLHPAFVKNGTNVSARYIGAYEGVLYDVSAARYTNGLYLTASSTTFAVTTNVITQAGRTNPFSRLQVGDKIVVSGTVNNNGTKTVSVAGAQSITVSEALVTETAASAVIEIERDWTATTGDKLASVNAKAPMNMGTRANFRAVAKNRGTGWRQEDYDLISAVQLLYLTEYASFYSQSTIGAGITNVGDWAAYNDYNPIAPTGNSNVIGNATGNTAGATLAATEITKYLSYRGIENFFGHVWKWVDGININSNVPYVSNNDTQFADDTLTNYTALGVTLSGVDGWQNTLAKIARGFLPLTVGASSTTKITDYYWQNTGWRVAVLGGSAGDGANAGAFSANLYSASSHLYRSISGRLAF